MEQTTKALNALEPFLALSKSATSPRAAADLIARATSASNTFLFAELLQTPQIQALAANAEFASHFTLLQIFSYGTYQTYNAAPGLPTLTDSQTLKLRQLSLVSLARDRANLSYDALKHALGLSSNPELEDLVIAAVYEGLLHATLDPARQAVHVTSVSPMRDLAPGSIPGMITALESWSARCNSTLSDLDEQTRSIRQAAAARHREKCAADERIQNQLAEMGTTEKSASVGNDAFPTRSHQRRAVMDAGGRVPPDETMDVDDPAGAEEQKKRASKRKM